MTKRKSLSKKTVNPSASPVVGRVVVESSRRGSINPGPSPEAVSKIERFEASNSRAEQRLGGFRLS